MLFVVENIRKLYLHIIHDSVDDNCCVQNTHISVVFIEWQFDFCEVYKELIDNEIFERNTIPIVITITICVILSGAPEIS